MRDILNIALGTTIKLLLNYNGKPLDLNSVTRLKMQFIGSSYEADTNIDSSVMEWNSQKGVIKLKLNNTGFSGEHDIKLIAYDTQNPNGITLVHSHIHNVALNFL